MLKSSSRVDGLCLSASCCHCFLSISWFTRHVGFLDLIIVPLFLFSISFLLFPICSLPSPSRPRAAPPSDSGCVCTLFFKHFFLGMFTCIILRVQQEAHVQTLSGSDSGSVHRHRHRHTRTGFNPLSDAAIKVFALLILFRLNKGSTVERAARCCCSTQVTHHICPHVISSDAAFRSHTRIQNAQRDQFM